MNDSNLSMIERLKKRKNEEMMNEDEIREGFENDKRENELIPSQQETKERKERKEDENEMKEKESNSQFQCSICLDTCQNPVVTQCGHMYCWECLREWLDQQKTCPMCHSQVTEETVIPIFTGSDSTDPRSIPRPQAHYTPAPEPEPRRRQHPFMFGGFGGPQIMFEFGLPGLMFNFGQFGANWNERNNQEELTEEQKRSRRNQMILITLFCLMPLIIKFISFFYML